MANYSDLEELGVLDDPEDALTISFNHAADHLKKIVSSIDNQTLLTLYAYFKQGTEGKCNVPKPSWYDIRAKSKWEAWKNLDDLPMEKAKMLYIEKVKEIDATFDDSNSFTNPKESWVRVSTLLNPESNEIVKTIIDHIKEKNLKEIERHLNSATKENINELDGSGLTILHWSADSGYHEALELIISAGANVNQKDSDGQTALHYASSCGHIECIKLLLNYNARIDILDNDGLSPVMVAFDETVKSMLISS